MHQRPMENSRSQFHCCCLSTATKQGSHSNACTHARVPQLQLHRAGRRALQSCKAALCICILNQETKEGLAALLPSTHPCSHGCAEPGPVLLPDRPGLDMCLIDCCLQPQVFVPQVPPAISAGAFQIPSVMCASSLRKTRKYFIECSGMVRLIKLVWHTGVFNTISRSLAKPARSKEKPQGEQRCSSY